MLITDTNFRLHAIAIQFTKQAFLQICRSSTIVILKNMAEVQMNTILGDRIE